jgi:GNAT superfamily N-acetyltransferase
VAVVVRDARPGEGRRIEQIRVSGWGAYRGLFDDAYLDDQQVDEERVARWERWLVEPEPDQVILLAEDASDPVGMAALGRSRDEDLPEAAELYALYVQLDRRFRGVGTALLTAGFGRFEAPLQTLWTLSGNTAGRRFYERHGFVADGAEKVVDHPGRPVEVRYRRRLR